MIAPPVLALAALALPLGGARYAFEIAGERVGVAEISVRCEGQACTAVWATTTRLPAEAGGAMRTRRSTAEVDRAGRFRRGGAVVVEERGEVRRFAGRAGAVASSVAEIVLAAEAPGRGDLCVEVVDDHGIRGTACARREGGRIAMALPGGKAEVLPAEDGFPAEVRIPGQGVRFVRDPSAAVPAAAPRLHGTRVAGPADPGAATSFCGVDRDPQQAAEYGSRLPAPRAAGGNCREKTLDYLSRAARAGVEGRAAVGVAFDGAGFVWHAWAELKLDGGWIPVDPTFGQSPAQGPRFTLAVYAPGDLAQEDEAGRRVLACWGRAEVSALPRRRAGP